MPEAPSAVLTPSFSAKEVCFARTNHSHAFSSALLSQRKAAVKCLRGAEVFATLGEFYRGRRKGGECQAAAPVGILLWCLLADLPNQFRLNSKACSNIQIIGKDFSGFIQLGLPRSFLDGNCE